MNNKDLFRLGVPPGEATRRGMDFISRYVLKGLDKSRLPAETGAIVVNDISGGVVSQRTKNLSGREMEQPLNLREQLALRPLAHARHPDQQHGWVKFFGHGLSFNGHQGGWFDGVARPNEKSQRAGRWLGFVGHIGH